MAPLGQTVTQVPHATQLLRSTVEYFFDAMLLTSPPFIAENYGYLLNLFRTVQPEPDCYFLFL